MVTVSGSLYAETSPSYQWDATHSLRNTGLEQAFLFTLCSCLVVWPAYWSILYIYMYITEHVARMGEERGAYRILVGRPEGRRPLGKPRRRWDDNIKMDIREVGGGGRNWIELAQDRDRWLALVNAVMNLRVPWNAGNFLTSWETVSFSRRPLLHVVS
jgi:hypothetical protein